MVSAPSSVDAAPCAADFTWLHFRPLASIRSCRAFTNVCVPKANPTNSLSQQSCGNSFSLSITPSNPNQSSLENNTVTYDTPRRNRVASNSELRNSSRAGRLEAPELTLPDPNDATVQRCFRRIVSRSLPLVSTATSRLHRPCRSPSRSIPEFGGRVLRVTVNRTVEPKRVVSVFCDRKMKGKL
jgi:hypothetical protein